jgi:hypothetical protein
MDQILAKLEQIQQLWMELEHMNIGSLEYETLIKRIHTLSKEYQALVDARLNPSKSK